MPWKPGQSGNPGGRTPGLRHRIRQLVDPDELVGICLGVARDGGAKARDRLEAVNLLWCHGWGRPHQSLSIDADVRNEVMDMLALTPEQRAHRIRELEARRAAAAPGELAAEQPAAEAEVAAGAGGEPDGGSGS